MDGESETSSSFKQKAKKRGAAVKLSTDPQSVAARERRHRISNRFKILQSMVPGGTKMDTVSMLEEAIHYVKYLKTQIWLHQAIMSAHHQPSSLSSFQPPPPPPPLCSPSPSSLSLPPLPSSCFQDLEEPTQLSPYFY